MAPEPRLPPTTERVVGEPLQTVVADAEMLDGADEVVSSVTVNVLAALVPQLFDAVTEIVPLAPAVAVIAVVPCPEVIDQPEGTDQE